MSITKQQIVKQLCHNIAATICGCILWYIVAEKTIITQTKEVPIYFYNINTMAENFSYPSTATITIAVSPSLLLSLSTKDIAVHLDAHKLPKNSTVLTEYQSAIVLPKGIKIVHCNPIIIHKLEKNTFS